MKPVIERVFRCRIDFDGPYVILDKISKQAHKWAQKAKLECSNTCGGPAWNAYVVLEGGSEAAVRKVAGMILRYTARFREAKILE